MHKAVPLCKNNQTERVFHMKSFENYRNNGGAYTVVEAREILEEALNEMAPKYLNNSDYVMRSKEEYINYIEYYHSEKRERIFIQEIDMYYYKFNNCSKEAYDKTLRDYCCEICNILFPIHDQNIDLLSNRHPLRSRIIKLHYDIFEWTIGKADQIDLAIMMKSITDWLNKQYSSIN